MRKPASSCGTFLPAMVVGLVLLPAFAAGDGCPCDALRAQLAAAEAELKGLEADLGRTQAQLGANKKQQKAARDRLGQVDEALANAKKTFARSVDTDGTQVEARYDLTTGDRVTRTTPPGAETGREPSSYLKGLLKEKADLPATINKLEQQQKALEKKEKGLQDGIKAAKDKIKDLRKKLQDCLKSCPPEVTLEIDSTSHVAFHALGDPSTALDGIEGANWFQLPAEVGNGWLVSIPVGAEGQLGDLVEDGTLEKVGKDYCRIMQPLAPTPPQSEAPQIDVPPAAADALGVELGVSPVGGTSLPDDTVAKVDPAPPTIEDFVENRSPGWDDLSPTLVRVGPDGRFTVPPVSPWGWEWLGRLLDPWTTLVRVGSGWASKTARVETTPEPPEEPGTPTLEWKPDPGLSYGGYDVGYKWKTGVRLGSGLTYGGTITFDDDWGDDPRDTPPPVTYGEDPPDLPVGILLTRRSDTWVPRNGSYTYVDARIYEKPPGSPWWVPSERKRVITIRFFDRSNEPGMCLNKDLENAPQDSPDLYFDKFNETHSTCSSDPSGKGYLFGTCVTKSPVNLRPFSVASEDYGSWSRLVATCPDCTPLKRPTNRPSGAPEDIAVEANVVQKEHLVALPKDDNDNQIADRHEDEKGLKPKADDDDETEPTGDGTTGDGYSAYEEYRGFVDEYRSHRRTDWKKKTLLVDNRVSLSTSFFETQSGLEVVEIKPDGHDSDRVANFKHHHAHVVDQHCLIAVREPLVGAAGRSSDFGPPKNVEKVMLDTDTRGNHTFAHELGHATGMRHHGDPLWSSDSESTIYPLTSTWRDLIPFRKVHSGVELCGKQLPQDFTIGVKGDQASGVQNCIMRYNYHRDIYPQDAGDWDCHWKGKPREAFCDTSNGTGFNRMGRTADNASRGDCKGQIIVNDK